METLSKLGYLTRYREQTAAWTTEESWFDAQ